jgi:fumarate hydratase class II
MGEFRIERDTMGEMQVPIDALYGASTARAVDNFPIAHQAVPARVIRAFGHLKAACALANQELGKLDDEVAAAIVAASDEVAAGDHDAHFPVDVYQTGSGTSTNMNANEVIAHLANRSRKSAAGKDGDAAAIHPNDDVNRGQSSNDTFPTAMHIAAAQALQQDLVPALKRLQQELESKSRHWDAIVKVGRTHLMDATPIRVGQVFSGYAQQATHAVALAESAIDQLARSMPIGGTAVGTGINTHPQFAQRVCDILARRTGIPFQEAPNHPEAQAAKDTFVNCHGMLKTIAVSLSKIANDIRHLGSGPRCGINELNLPATQPGSSIMPGKVNPVICEAVMQVACRVVGNDTTVTLAGMGGIGSLFELNVAMPVMVDAFDESVQLLANVSNVLVDKLLNGLTVNEKRCRELLDGSLMTVTKLAPRLGYEKCAKLAKQALAENLTIKQIVRAENLLSDEELDELLDYDGMTRPAENDRNPKSG